MRQMAAQDDHTRDIAAQKKGDPKIAQLFRGGPGILFAEADPQPDPVHLRVADSGGFETDLW